VRRVIQRFKDLLHYNTTEQRGLVVLFILLIFVITAHITLPLFISEQPGDFTGFLQEIEAYELRQARARDSIAHVAEMNPGFDRQTAGHIQPFYFDPNHLPEEKWKQLGLSEQQIAVIKNFESKGGRFRSADDLARMYSISSAEFKVLKPFVVIKTAGETEPKPLQPFIFDPNTIPEEELTGMGLEERVARSIVNSRNKGGQFRTAADFQKIYGLKEADFLILEPFLRIESVDPLPPEDFPDTYNLLVDLNHADTLDLQQLNGIGPAFASRIVKYRDLLGGFCRKEQLLEVFGMDSVRYEGIAGNVLVTDEDVKKININTATLKELMAHPYIEFYLAKSIVSHRQTIGRYSNLEELMNARLIYEDLYYKIAPYLTL
jgi:DNA uptake protein ComE-like DNA-binding protein